MNCRPGCAACCIAPSISTPIPPLGGGRAQPKPAGVPCPQLDEHGLCRLFGSAQRPAVCASLRPEPTMCGSTRTHALQYLQALETATLP